MPGVKYWEIIADNLSKAGWSLGCVSALESSVSITLPASSKTRITVSCERVKDLA
jgi:hypothetical protein